MDRTGALLELIRYLRRRAYRFTTVTPETHARVLARPAPAEPSLADIFGWNRPFAADSLDPEALELLRRADALEEAGDVRRSGVRVSSLGDDLFVHSGFPTDDEDAVFFGPDTYRFAAFVARRLPDAPRRVVDMGTGTGAGGIAVARLAPSAAITLVDRNPAALALAQVNAAAAGVAATLLEADAVPPGADLVVANPPYMIDAGARTYRDGGGLLGGEVAQRWAAQALDGLAPGGTLLLYTGAAYAGGQAPLLAELERMAAEAGAELAVEELDPDVFGEELDKPGYETVERIAAIGAVLRLPG